MTRKSLNSLTNIKILDWPKLKAFVDNKINMIQKLKYDLGRIEKIVRKGKFWVVHSSKIFCNNTSIVSSQIQNWCK